MTAPVIVVTEDASTVPLVSLSSVFRLVAAIELSFIVAVSPASPKSSKSASCRTVVISAADPVIVVMEVASISSAVSSTEFSIFIKSAAAALVPVTLIV